MCMQIGKSGFMVLLQKSVANAFGDNKGFDKEALSAQLFVIVKRRVTRSISFTTIP